MTPERELENIVRPLCPDCGHWPFTQESELYVGWRAGDDGPFTFAKNRPTRVEIVYDLVICATRARLGEMEDLRFRLYDALRGGGWRLDGIPGPETYVAATQMYLWPFSVRKGFAIDEEGMPCATLVPPSCGRRESPVSPGIEGTRPSTFGTPNGSGG